MPGAAGQLGLRVQPAPLRDGDRQRRKRQNFGHGAPPQRRGALGVLYRQGRSWCQGVQVMVTDGSKSYRSAINAISDTPAVCLTASTPSGGSRPGSQRRAATYSAASR